MEVPETWDMDTLTEIGYKLKEANPEYTLIAKNGSTVCREILYFYGMDGFGSSSAVYGVLLNPETDTTVSNLFKSDEFKEYCKYNIEWKENGFMPADQAVNGRMLRMFINPEQASVTGLQQDHLKKFLYRTILNLTVSRPYSQIHG